MIHDDIVPWYFFNKVSLWYQELLGIHSALVLQYFVVNFKYL
jgi:hypothetical protein